MADVWALFGAGIVGLLAFIALGLFFPVMFLIAFWRMGTALGGIRDALAGKAELGARVRRGDVEQLMSPEAAYEEAVIHAKYRDNQDMVKGLGIALIIACVALGGLFLAMTL